MNFHRDFQEFITFKAPQEGEDYQDWLTEVDFQP